MEYLPLIGTAAFVQLLALISPGPDFIMAVRNSLRYSRKTGIWTAVGFGGGIAVHVFYSLAGLALVISQSILIFNTIKYIGAGYLVYIGLKSLFSKTKQVVVKNQEKRHDISAIKAVKIGFLTNVLNPKATLFFLSLFTLVISPDTPFPILLIIGAIMILQTIAWFSLVAVFMTQRHVRSVYTKAEGFLNRTLGALLVALGVKIALTEK